VTAKYSDIANVSRFADIKLVSEFGCKQPVLTMVLGKRWICMQTRSADSHHGHLADATFAARGDILANVR
jgi:hypothetical protein